MKRILYFLLAAGMLAMFGCTGDTNSTTTSNSVGTPNPNTLMPTGTIQGVLTDSCTNMPIAGAIVDIGVARTTTTGTGQFTLVNVPATASTPTTTGLLGTLIGSYTATIDLRGVNKAITSGPKYPDVTYRPMVVTFSSLQDTKVILGTNSSNHDTPVDQYVSGSQNLSVGKASTSIKVTVLDANRMPVGAGYSVSLNSLAFDQILNPGPGPIGTSSETIGGGANGLVVGTATTGADSTFTFTGVQAAQTFNISVVSPAGDFANPTTLVITACDGGTRNVTILVAPTDGFCPIIVSTTPFQNADIDPAVAANHNITFTFNKPIVATPKNSGQGLTGSDLTGLYSQISVNYLGLKASNIVHTVTTNQGTGTTFTTITVNIPTLGAAGKYSVKLEAGAAALLKDAAGNSLANTSGCAAFTGNEIDFTTFGSAPAAQPTGLTITNAATIDFNSPMNLQWDVDAGAKSYNVYCGENQVFSSSSTNAHQAQLVANVTATNYSFDPAVLGLINLPSYNFVENNAIQLTWTCYVAALNADHLEGAPSASVTGKDVVGPILVQSPVPGDPTYVAQIATLLGPGPGNTTLVLNFDEPLNAISAGTPGNYTIDPAGYTGTPPTVTSAVYAVVPAAGPVPQHWTVTLTLSGPLDPTKIVPASIDSGLNGINESTAAGADTVIFVNGNGLANTTCIAAGTNGTIETVPNAVPPADDVLVPAVPPTLAYISSNTNGICDTAKLVGSDDVQVIPQGNGLASQTEIVAGSGPAGTTLASTRGGDDVVHTFNLITVSNVKDVAGNTIRSIGDQITTDGVIH